MVEFGNPIYIDEEISATYGESKKLAYQVCFPTSPLNSIYCISIVLCSLFLHCCSVPTICLTVHIPVS